MMKYVLPILTCLSAHALAQDDKAYPHTMTRLEGATLPVFTDWNAQTIQGEANTHDIVMSPKSAANESFAVRIIVALPGSAFAKDLEGRGRRLVATTLKGFQRVGEPSRFKLQDGSIALGEELSGEMNGTRLRGVAVYAPKGNGGIVLIGIGTDAGMKKYGASLGVLLAKTGIGGGGVLTKTEPVGVRINAVLVGTWVWEMSSGGDYPVSSKISVTIRADGSYSYYAITITSHSDAAPSEIQDGGTVTQEGDVLTFKSKSGQTQRVQYRMKGTGLLYADNRAFIKQ